MEPMTSYERVKNTLERKPVDCSPAVLSPWGSTVKRWTEEGHLKEGEDLGEHFGHDLRGGGWLNSVADLDFEPVTIEEDEETILRLDGNGAKLRQHKLHESTPEHVDFTVKDRRGWEEKTKPRLVDFDKRRISIDGYRTAREFAAEKQRFFTWSGVAPFEQMHPVCGHEYMLLGMAEDPDWVKDMVMTYANMTIAHLEVLFAEAGEPDGMFFYEDMGFKQRPFMSPAMYKEILQPGHKRLFDFARARGLRVIVHSCGFIEPLVPGLVEAGMDCLQAMEVKAGMDMVRLARQYAGRLSFYGNIDVRVLITNDRDKIDEELKAKIPPVLDLGCGYVLHSDHSEPPQIDYETAWYFLDRGREISRRHN